MGCTKIRANKFGERWIFQMNEKIMKETGKLGFGQCESVCPQGIPVINELKRAAEMIE